jgi:uncharacterized repeat protein (TIGR02543 family)
MTYVDRQIARARVFASLNNATANGYDFAGWTDDMVAIDLNRFDADCANIAHAELIEHVQAWRAQQ